MAEDSAKEESKDNLKFFKNAKGQSEDPAEAKDEVKKSDEKPVDRASSDAEGTVAQPAGKPAEVVPKVKRERTGIMPLLAPSIALAIRTLVILAIIVADAYAAYFLVVKGIAPRMAEARAMQARAEMMKPEQPREVREVATEKEQLPLVGTITPVEDIVVNPSGTSGTRYLCTTVALEAIEPGVAVEIGEREPQIRDLLIEILGKRTVDDLSSLETRENLRGEIKEAINELLASGDVIGVYFSNFVLQ
jgi:flagellar FliL protein